MAEFEVTSNAKLVPGADYFNRQDEAMTAEVNALTTTVGHPLDSAEARKEHKRLLEWFYFEKDKQTANRLEMAMDQDFYDNQQWDEQDAVDLKDRGQMPLVYNEVAPMIDWLIGTERRARVDWKVLPRLEDHVEMADTKTKVMKFVSDINRLTFLRSRAFADAVKVGVGWMDDGARDDPSEDILYSKYQDWRNVLWDSLSYELDLSDARYIFRWRWVDEDIALMMFPDRADQIKAGIEDSNNNFYDGSEEDTWQTPLDQYNLRSGQSSVAGMGAGADAKRRRIKLIECQYRKPTQVKVVADGHFKGTVVNLNDHVMTQHLGQSNSMIIDKVMMRMHIAVFTERDFLGMGPSVYRHNRFSLTPIWCYRNGRDRLPYGAIRRVRDIQQDLNKRASKALWLMNTNQVIMDEGAVDDIETLRDEVSKPNGLIVKKHGRELKIHRDTDAATGQIQMMAMDSQNIQKAAGVAQENMGRQTNAVSGEAIKARQMQGSVVTTEPFDNLRYATQVQGEKKLSLCEQFYTEEKVIRLTGSKGALEWVKINQPELQPDGSVRFINDITASQADFIVAEQDYSGTLRQVMFDSINQLAGRVTPEVGLRLMTIAMDFSDLPNKDEIVDEFRKITGERDTNKPMSPEEAKQAEDQLAQQAEALQIQRETALTMLQEQKGKVRELNAKAAVLESQVQAQAGAGSGADQGVIDQVRKDARAEIDRLSDALRKAQSEAANKTMQINREADVKLEVARIDADAKIRAAEIQRASDKAIETLTAKLEALAAQMDADTSGEGGTATGGKAKPKDQSGAPGMTLNVTGNVSLQSNSAQIESSTVNVETPSVAVDATGGATVNADSVALQSDNTQIDGSPTVNVAGDLNAANTVIEKTVTAMPPKNVVVERDKSGRIVGAKIESGEA
jgi:hypothetical protein